ncbi:MAG: rod shape-determining protein MreC [Proteobacteria bacterium]|nr:rod shape-determining protein MreC [Pseudomonadota bacterium]MBU4029116.1 rod shape-determining protein MreC [Pseudomonadota bacterium]MBU4041803.1 rod shape-determining protein MreC [Pseudomonadota bacterium]MBU4085219.1 rod shape-determining protein MreC [Pseudomonadota bacterium]MBU4108053.1 rod shape-determining protein MreC [Pseudomonadota bacterium]
MLLSGLFLFGSTVGGQYGVVQQMIMQGLGPVQGGVSRVIRSLQVVTDDYLVLWSIRDDNKRLRLLIADYQQQLDQYREAYAKNRYLENELKFKKEENFPSLTARVVGKDPSFWFQTLIVDRGKSDGVIEGMVARTSLGVVGQVIQVSDNYSKILLSNAPSSAIDAMIQKNRVRGILKGAADKGYVLYYVLKNADVAVGDRVVTAGIGGVFPSGIPLGTVSALRSKRRGMFQEIEVAPIVDFGQLEMVFIDLSARQEIAEEMGLSVEPVVE